LSPAAAVAEAPRRAPAGSTRAGRVDRTSTERPDPTRAAGEARAPEARPVETRAARRATPRAAAVPIWTPRPDRVLADRAPGAQPDRAAVLRGRRSPTGAPRCVPTRTINPSVPAWAGTVAASPSRTARASTARCTAANARP